MDATQTNDSDDRPAAPYLDEAGLAALNAAATKGLEALNSHLDDIVGVNDPRRWFSEASGEKNAPLEYGSLHFLTLDSQDPHRLLKFLRDPATRTMDRLIASLRMMQVPDSLRAGCPTDQFVKMCEEAQRVLSNILVDNPALLHPRIFISGLPLGSIYRGPICHAMVHSELVEMPRARHGIDEARLRAFARSPFLKAGLQNVAPKSLETRHKNHKNMAFQGKSCLKVLADAGRPKTPFILSVLELDELRKPKNGRPTASLLRFAEPMEGGFLSLCHKGILVEAGFTGGGSEVWRERLDGFTAAVTRTKTIDAQMLCANIGQHLHGWAGVPDYLKADALRNLVHLLVTAQPTTLRTPEQEVMGRPCTAIETAQWVMETLLKPSTRSLQNLRVDAHAAAIFLTTMAEFFPAAAKDGSLYARVEKMLGASIDDSWRAALVEKRMHLQIDDAMANNMPNLQRVHRAARVV
ncbi:hypothetical protein ABIC83_002508 [Roseateles asaccharophilus]|uniref:hypothetical protein n=1 Tax=Roseateles asaccharophilus TaxID=582607 RepID=UPI00383942EE